MLLYCEVIIVSLLFYHCYSGGNYTDHTWCSWTHVNPHPANSTLVLTSPGYYLEPAYSDNYCR